MIIVACCALPTTGKQPVATLRLAFNCGLNVIAVLLFVCRNYDAGILAFKDLCAAFRL